jgi:hypothetical protein
VTGVSAHILKALDIAPLFCFDLECCFERKRTHFLPILVFPSHVQHMYQKQEQTNGKEKKRHISFEERSVHTLYEVKKIPFFTSKKLGSLS